MIANPTIDQAPISATDTRRVPGNKGIWAGITCEFVEFAVLFAVYFIARAHFPTPSTGRPAAVDRRRHGDHTADDHQQLLHRLLGQRHPPGPAAGRR
jgi:heme/copper-type cytochrome/quinol oxidase subunit 3